eukprot:6203301-Pleurochrysis_carterae.AAC.4
MVLMVYGYAYPFPLRSVTRGARQSAAAGASPMCNDSAYCITARTKAQSAQSPTVVSALKYNTVVTANTTITHLHSEIHS